MRKQDSDKGIELTLECLINLTMKFEFKRKLISEHVADLKAVLSKLLEKPSNLTGIVMALLNVARDSAFDEIPSYTYRKREELKEHRADLTYYQLKELKHLFSKSLSVQQQVNSGEMVNDYGTDPASTQRLRSSLIRDLSVLSILKGQVKTVRKHPFTLLIRMISELVLALSYERDLIPSLVAEGMISYLLDLRKVLHESTIRDFGLAKEAEMNIAQCLARLFLHTNTNLIQDHAKMDAISLLVKNLTDPRVHHELLLYEGLMALVSISADDESLRERMLANGAWANCRDLLSDKN